MLADSDGCKSSRTVDIILQCRIKHADSEEIRQFRVPLINYDASDYVELINWKDVYEPPVAMKLTNDELHNLIELPLTLS